MDCAEPGSAERRLWAGVLIRYTLDARAGLATGRAPDGGEAWRDLEGDQSILCRLCGYCDIDPEPAAAAIRRFSTSSTGKLRAAA